MVKSGRKHLGALENLEVNNIENKIKEVNANRIKEADNNKIKEKMLDKNGQVDFKRYYKNTVFMGDSLTEFIGAEGILDEKSVVATKGRDVITAKKDIEKLKALNPERIIMLFGMNDVITFNNSDDFKNKYIELVDEIKSALPRTEIYIESPMPVKSNAVTTNSRLTNENILKFRKASIEVAKEEAVKYLDTSVLVKTEKYFEPDGIHFIYDFYQRLLTYLKNTIEMNKNK